MKLFRPGQSKRAIFMTGLIISIILAVLSFSLFFTPSGIGILVKLYISCVIHPKSINIGKIESSFPEKILLKDIELKGIKGLPAGSKLRIQECRLSFMKFKLYCRVNNGTLRLPRTEPILFYGTYTDGLLDFNVYSKYIDIRDIRTLLPKRAVKINLRGGLANADISLSGSLQEPELKAQFVTKGIRYKTFSLSKCPVFCDVRLKSAGKELEIYGETHFREGTISARNLLITIKNSAIVFCGAPGKSTLDIQGQSIIEKIPITLTLRGTFNAPDLHLSSSPPMPESLLMIMLLTGKAWEDSGALATQGQISPSLIAEFIDYVVLGGSGSRLAAMLGIDEVGLRYDRRQKGIKVKKAISDKLEATYEIEQPQTKEGVSAATHKVGGEYKITDTISIGAEKELTQEKSKTENSADKSSAEDKVTIKYKKEF
ncbi:MAG: translocation/assembly module TamB domain-containing protein [Candidatus Omnitrophota bacterium]